MKKPVKKPADPDDFVVRVIRPRTKVVMGKIVVISDDSLDWEAPIYHLS